MKITVDTNVFVRVIARDNEPQARLALKLLSEAELVAVSLSCLCEIVWVLRKVYNFGKQDILLALNTLLNAGNVVVNRQAVEVGLDILNAGGDFADGLIAYEGNWLGGETFVSFDRKAVALLERQGQSTTLLK